MLLSEYYQFRSPFNAPKLYGIEIEMEGIGLPSVVGGWVPKNDGSLRGESLEYITNGAQTYENAVKLVNNLWESFRDRGALLRPSERCAVHIHLNCQDLEVADVWKVAGVFFMLEDVLLSHCGEQRFGSHFCLTTDMAPGYLRALVQDKRSGQFRASTAVDMCKYSFIAFNSIPRFGTIEIRGMQTERTPDNIIHWLDIVKAVREYALSGTDPMNVLHRASLYGPMRIMTEIFGTKLAKEIAGDDIEAFSEMFMNGVRRVQILISTEYKETRQAPASNPYDRLKKLRILGEPAVPDDPPEPDFDIDDLIDDNQPEEDDA